MEFEEEYWINQSSSEIRFRGRTEDETILVRISQEALTDRFNTEDTMDEAESLFNQYRDRIEDVAIDLFEDDPGNEVLITYDILSGYQL